jgi:hypothetical protein
VLILRAAGDIVFNNALSDGFTPSPDNGSLWLAPLLPFNPNLPANAQSWSYKITAGADFSSAALQTVSGTGSVLVGRNAGVPSLTDGFNSTTSSAVDGFYQPIRTGSADISIRAGGDVRLMNVFFLDLHGGHAGQ